MENQQPQKLLKLTKKQRGFVEDYIETENGTQSALKNYDTTDYKTASVIAAENLDKPSIQVAIEVKRKSLKQALIDKGITEDYLAEKVEVLLTASKETKDADGNVKTEIDYTAVDKGLKHATSIYGVIDPDDKPKQTNTTYNFIFSDEVQDKVKMINESIKSQLIKGNVQSD